VVVEKAVEEQYIEVKINEHITGRLYRYHLDNNKLNSRLKVKGKEMICRVFNIDKVQKRIDLTKREEFMDKNSTVLLTHN
jgi:hypothetical protein